MSSPAVPTPAAATVPSSRPAGSRPASEVDVELETMIRARYPIIYVVSWEERRVEEALREICQRRGKKMFLWTLTTGMAGDAASKDPLAALNYVLSAADQSVFVLKDFHPFITDVAVTRRLRDLVYALKSSYKTLIILSPLLKLPPELEKEISVVDYQLPTLNDLDRLLEGIIQSVRANPQIKTDLAPLEREQILKAAMGLTSNEAENVFAKSLVEKRGFDIDVILGEKEQIIRKSGILEYYRFSDAFSDVGGMDILKDWMNARTVSFTEDARRYGLPEPKGILLLGVQGCGKSLVAKSIASLWKLPLLRLDVGKIFAGIVGSSEENMRKAIATAESVAPCVAGDTRITLADGSERAIADLYDDQSTQRLSVLGMTADYQIAPVAVRAVTRRPAPDLFTVRLRHGTLQATSNHLHPVLRHGELCWVRTDALQTSDYVAVPRQIPTAAPMPRTADFLPAGTRLYADGALAFARPEAQSPQRRYAAAMRGADFVKLSELADGRTGGPAWDTITRFAFGRGGTADSTLPQLPPTLNEEIGYLLGLVASDGFLGGRGSRVGFVNTDHALHRRFAHLLCRNFGLSATTRLNETPAKTAQLPGTSENSVFRPCFTTYVDNRLLRTLLGRVEERLLTLPAPFLNAWLRGYFDGDGCVSDSETGADPKITLTAKRASTNRLVRSVLQRVGLPATNPNEANITITGSANVRRFIEQVGSNHPCRAARMNAWRERATPVQEKDRTDLIPVGERLRRARRAIGMGSHQFRSASSSLVHRYEHGVGHPNRERLRALVNEMRAWATARQQAADTGEVKAIAALVDSSVLWSQVTAVTPEAAPEFVYDLVCDDPHTFIANGIVTHNCILWLDELEKGFAGTQSSPFSDGGTTSRVFATFLTWLQEKEAACFVIATSNDVSQLPPELMRKGRFDEIFFVDLPAVEERDDIFAIHLRKRGRDPQKFDLDLLARRSVGYSGAEIESAVVSSLYDSFADNQRELTTDDLLKTMSQSVPLSVTMREGIARLREWAETRARPASSAEAESTDELVASAASDDGETVPRRLPRATATALPAPSLGAEEGHGNNSSGDANETNVLNDRLAVLERKLGTGLDAITHSPLNAGALAPALPVVEAEGTGAPTTGGMTDTASSTTTINTGTDDVTDVPAA